MGFLFKHSYTVAIVIAIFLASGAFAYKFFFSALPGVSREIPSIGKVNSDHAHASLMIMVGDRPINFCDPKYMVKSPLVHFEENNCQVVHKHATGVTIQTFLPTIGVELSDRCLVLPAGESLCREGVRRVRIMYNGKEISVDELAHREIRNNDHVLINYGAEDDLKLRFKYNQIPNIPPHINQPFVAE